jgi:hypothetical protein
MPECIGDDTGPVAFILAGITVLILGLRTYTLK